MIKNGPFRRTNSDSYRTFASDILDGYFPSEFKDVYPDGVIFDLIDHHNDVFYDSISKDGAGHKNGTTAVPTQQFLNRLPKTVVQNGNIVNVREDIAARLQSGGKQESGAASRSSSVGSISATNNPVPVTGTSNSKGNVVMQTFVIRTGLLDSQGEVVPGGASANSGNDGAATGSSSSAAAAAASDAKDVVKVNIRWIDDKKTVLQAAMFAYDTVLHLRQELALHFGVAVDDEMAAEVLELRTAYPAKVLSDAMTLREAGLVPNGTVHARRLGNSAGVAALDSHKARK
jgi:hypothetical protein